MLATVLSTTPEGENAGVEILHLEGHDDDDDCSGSVIIINLEVKTLQEGQWHHNFGDDFCDEYGTDSGDDH